MIRGGTITILAIDDDTDILYTLEAIGKTMGWKVYTEPDSEKAVTTMIQCTPDIILIDYHMPKQDGLSTVKAIRNHDRLVPILVLTVDERQEIADQFLMAGASDFANKPIKVADLAARIAVHMRLAERPQSSPESPFCEKGINGATLSLVRAACQQAQGPFLIEDIVEVTGLAYQTAFRYLQYLQTRKELVATSDYGKVGRPRKRYQYGVKK